MIYCILFEFCYVLTEYKAALVTYVTAGFPTADESPDVMLAMQAGGAGQFPPVWKT